MVHEQRFISSSIIEFFDISCIGKIIEDVMLNSVVHVQEDYKKEIEASIRVLSRKCMGFPPIWLFQNAFNLEYRDIYKLLQESSIALSISLSTSVVDDLMDHGPLQDPKYVAAFYLFLSYSLDNNMSKKNTNKIDILKEFSKVIPAFVPLNKSNVPADFSGIRIGIFHKLIAKELCIASTSLDGFICKDAIIDFSYKFGCFCALLDDIMDIEYDLINKLLHSLPIKLLIESNNITIDEVSDSNINELINFKNSEKFKKEILMLCQEKYSELLNILEDFFPDSKLKYILNQKKEHLDDYIQKLLA